MQKMDHVFARLARAMTVVFAFAILAGCADFYVDSSLHDLAADEKVKIADAKPVQLLFDFQTKGVHNGQATDNIKGYVVSAVQNSGLFSSVGNDPVPDGAVLSVVLNNVPLTDDAFAKGFMTGFTLGLAGSTVGDGYVCTIDYLPGGASPKISKTMQDAIYTSLGATAGTPPHAEKMPSLQNAVETMTRRIVSNTLNELAKEPDFDKSAHVAAQ